jgi:hypothetical protein
MLLLAAACCCCCSEGWKWKRGEKTGKTNNLTQFIIPFSADNGSSQHTIRLFFALHTIFVFNPFVFISSRRVVMMTIEAISDEYELQISSENGNLV